MPTTPNRAVRPVAHVPTEVAPVVIAAVTVAASVATDRAAIAAVTEAEIVAATAADSQAALTESAPVAHVPVATPDQHPPRFRQTRPNRPQVPSNPKATTTTNCRERDSARDGDYGGRF